MLAVAFLMDFVGKCSLNTDQFLFLRSENFIVEMNPKQLSWFLPGMRMNKPLYTISYTLATAGAAGLLFAGIYTLVSPLNPRTQTIYMKAPSTISESHGNYLESFRWTCTGLEDQPLRWSGWGSMPWWYMCWWHATSCLCSSVDSTGGTPTTAL